MANPTARLAIIIVNWNTGPLLRLCLQSILTTEREGLRLDRVVVVDNASDDGSADGLEQLGLPLTVIRNPTNRGFSAACNQAAARSSADYLLFLNPDTRLLPGSLAVPVAFLESQGNEHVGIVGVQLLDDTGHVAHSCARFLTPGMILRKMLGWHRASSRAFPTHFMTDWDHQDSRVVDHVTGAFFLVRRPLFAGLGGFDERFFVYLEDLDFSLRARNAGWRSVYLAEARAHHLGGGSSDRIRARRLFYALHSRILYTYKHFDWWVATGLTLATLLLEMFSRLVLAVLRGSPREATDTLKAYYLLWTTIPAAASVARRRGSQPFGPPA